MSLDNMRGHLFHTLLSILGIIIGVAALVAILSLIDGMEEFAKDQITKTTSLKAVMVSSQTTRRVNDINIKIDTTVAMNYETLKAVEASFTLPAKAYLVSEQSAEVVVSGKPVVSLVLGTTEAYKEEEEMAQGRRMTAKDLEQGARVAVVGKAFLKAAGVDSTSTFTGTKVSIQGETYEVIGVLNQASRAPFVLIPVSCLSEHAVNAHPPMLVAEAAELEDVNSLKELVSTKLKDLFGAQYEKLQVVTNGWRVEQATKGFQLFRIIMGLIVGISVLVGGIGVMNVLLISVTQRTMEIGIRKAVGATRRNIIQQFLAESMVISFLGSITGLLLGVLGTMAFVPIIKAITKMPFQASFTLNTMGVVVIISILVGIIFGTCPSRLTA